MVKRIGLDLCLRDLNPCSAIHQLCNLVQVIYPLNLSLLVYKMEIIIFIFWVEEEITCKALSIVPNKAHKHNAYIVQSILIICFLFWQTFHSVCGNHLNLSSVQKNILNDEVNKRWNNSGFAVSHKSCCFIMMS